MRRLCALYGVTRAGYYAWRSRAESARREQDRGLLSKIRGVFERSRGTYGSPRIQRALVSVGERVSRRRVERLMREAGLRARAAKLYRANPGLHGFFTSIPNRQLERLTTGPDQVWVGDVTYLKVAGAWRFLATVMDRYSRRVLGWSLGRHRDARLTLAALNRAVFNRRPRPGVIFHTDRGIEYAAYAFRWPISRAWLRAKHESARRDRRQRPHGVVLPLAEDRRRPWVQLRDRWSTRSAAPKLHPVLQPGALALGLGVLLAD